MTSWTGCGINKLLTTKTTSIASLTSLARFLALCLAYVHFAPHLSMIYNHQSIRLAYLYNHGALRTAHYALRTAHGALRTAQMRNCATAKLRTAQFGRKSTQVSQSLHLIFLFQCQPHIQKAAKSSVEGICSKVYHHSIEYAKRIKDKHIALLRYLVEHCSGTSHYSGT